MYVKLNEGEDTKIHEVGGPLLQSERHCRGSDVGTGGVTGDSGALSLHGYTRAVQNNMSLRCEL